jgi:hypothetical protein
MLCQGGNAVPEQRGVYEVATDRRAPTVQGFGDGPALVPPVRPELVAHYKGGMGRERLRGGQPASS